MSWYRLYRPQTVSGLHLTVARESLLQMIRAGKIAHALLFAGPKGTGKTSSARIVAKLLNCDFNLKRKSGEPFVEPCNTCQTCLTITHGSSLNVIEMDAASNRRIDDVRALREKMYLSPASGKKIVYIIDEVHMMTKEAFNALLKILEEPPEHAVFILATTEAQKLPETILSRTTLVQFQRATIDEIVLALEKIALEEKITISEAALRVIAQAADGSFRDAVKNFEQVAAGQSSISDHLVQMKFNGLSQLDLSQFVLDLLAKDEKKVVEFFVQLRSKNIDTNSVYKSLLEYLHYQLMVSLSLQSGQALASTQVLTFLLKQFQSVQVQQSNLIPFLDLEIISLEMILKSKKSVVEKKNLDEQIKPTTVVQPILMVSQIEMDVVPSNAFVLPLSESKVALGNGAMLKDRWNDLLHSIKRKNLSLEALLRSSQFMFGDEGKVVIEVFYQFHKEQLQIDRYKKMIEDEIEILLGGRVSCEYILSAQSTQGAKDPNANISGKVEGVGQLASLVDEVLF